MPTVGNICQLHVVVVSCRIQSSDYLKIHFKYFDYCGCTVGVFLWVYANLADISTSRSASSSLRKDCLGVNVTLKAGSTETTCDKLIKNKEYFYSYSKVHLPYFLTSNWEVKVFCCQWSNFAVKVHVPSLQHIKLDYR